MADVSEVKNVFDNSGAAPNATDGSGSIYIGEFSDGPNFTTTGKLVTLYGGDEIEKLGSVTAANFYPDMLKGHFEIAKIKTTVARLVGAGGVRASSGDVSDLNAAPTATIKATWEGEGTDGNLYDLIVAQGPLSTAAAGVGRVDTRLSIKVRASGVEVPGSAAVGRMNVTADNYLVNVFNSNGLKVKLEDRTPADSYENLDEPVVGTYPLTGGVNAAAATTTEKRALADRLAGLELEGIQVIGVVGWSPADVAYLAAVVGESLKAVIIDYQNDATSVAAAGAHADAIITDVDRVSVCMGWGTMAFNATKRIPGLCMVIAKILEAFNNTGSVNLTGSNEPVAKFTTFDTFTRTERIALAAKRVNPVYYVKNRNQNGVIVGDVLTLYKTDKRYAQIGSRRADDYILDIITSWLNANAKQRNGYVFAPKPASGAIEGVNQDSLVRIDGFIAGLFLKLPKSLLSGGRGRGWQWQGDVENVGSNVGEPFFLLGTDPAGVGRIFTVRYGRVEGRFGVQPVTGANV